MYIAWLQLRFFLKPNWLSSVANTDLNFSRIHYSKTFDNTGLIAIALKSLHDIALLRVSCLTMGLGVVQSHWKWRRSIDHIYDFLLVGHCKYSCMLYHFQVNWRWIIMTLKRSLNVVQSGTIRKLGCGFLFAFHSNYGRIFNRLWDTQR